jgi:hypothetical protein
MKDVLELQGQLFANRRGLVERYGISLMTASRWKALGILGEPIRIGKTSYYDLGQIEANLLSNGAAAGLGNNLFGRGEEHHSVTLLGLSDTE